MIVDWLCLMFNALGLRTLVDMLFRARLEDTWSPTTIKFGPGIWVIVNKANFPGDDVVL